MLSSQNGRCAICQSEDPKHKGSFFCVDHDHETGAVRALLCSPCNTRIGLLEHDSLPKLLDYMERFYGLDSN